MCRLLGYITASRSLSLSQVIGEARLDEFREISRIHNDGWGANLIAEAALPPHLSDGGAASPECYESLYRTTEPAFLDDNFTSVSHTSAASAIFHLRLASSNLPLIPANQQPFTALGIAFAHNGDISDENGVNLVSAEQTFVSKEEIAQTGGESDSALYFAHVLHFVHKGVKIETAVERAIAQLRAKYPDSSYNCLVQTPDYLVCVNATGHDHLAHRVAEVYDSYGMLEKAADYRVIRYKALDGGVVVASSGFDQSEDDGWHELPNNHILIASRSTGEFVVRELQ